MSSTDMRAIEAQTFSGYGGLRQVELPKAQPAKSRVLVRVAAAGVTPLDYTILSGVYPLGQASEALRHLMNDRPFGKVVLERISKYLQPSASRGRGCGH